MFINASPVSGCPPPDVTKRICLWQASGETPHPPLVVADGDFEPPFEEDDDEETIEVEEQQEGNDAETHKREIELLRQEGALPLDQLLHTLTHAQVVLLPRVPTAHTCGGCLALMLTSRFLTGQGVRRVVFHRLLIRCRRWR